MPRPGIVRADTIDLQNQDSPSAKDHSRKPAQSHDGTNGNAPHQQQTLRHVEEEQEAEEDNLQHLTGDSAFEEEPESYDDEDVNDAGLQHDAQAVRQNGIVDDEDMADAEGDDGLDDDMIDKISSSPSIDDGGSPTLPRWPRRKESLHASPRSTNSISFYDDEVPSSSPFVERPRHMPLLFSNLSHVEHANPSVHHHHIPGGFPTDEDEERSEDSRDDQSHLFPDLDHTESDISCHINRYPDEPEDGESLADFDEGIEDDFEDERRDQVSSLPGEQRGLVAGNSNSMPRSISDLERRTLNTLLLPADDPLLDTGLDEYRLHEQRLLPRDVSPPMSESSVVDSEPEGNDDDAYDHFFSDDPRFIDSGWGGECLREVEDIDFEFVYALHTFVATVEGQANATKGDTMVLLDDSNSYWWLVRVVKDGSIGISSLLPCSE